MSVDVKRRGVLRMLSDRALLRVVTGKGGVGKTSVALALALDEAAQGKRVLLAEANAGERVAALLGAKPGGGAMRELLPRVHVVDMTPREAMREYVLLTLRFESLYQTVFENRLVKHFLRLVPSLGELVMLGKVWYHVTSPRGTPQRFDVVILDAPATGHAIAMLRAPEVVRATVPAGPMRETARDMSTMLGDAEHTRLHVVTTPEEMPVAEATELEEAARTTLGMRLGVTFINQRVAPLPSGSLASLARLHTDLDLAPGLAALERREARIHMGEEYLARLPQTMREDSVALPRIVDPHFGRAAIETLARVLADRRAVSGGTR